MESIAPLVSARQVSLDFNNLGWLYSHYVPRNQKPTKDPIGARIRHIRTEICKETQLQFATKLRVSKGLVSQWELGETPAQLKELLKIAARGRKSLDYLVLGRAEPSGPIDERIQKLPPVLRARVMHSLHVAEEAVRRVPFAWNEPPDRKLAQEHDTYLKTLSVELGWKI